MPQVAGGGAAGSEAVSETIPDEKSAEMIAQATAEMAGAAWEIARLRPSFAEAARVYDLTLVGFLYGRLWHEAHPEATKEGKR
jgi:hypothetical protein